MLWLDDVFVDRSELRFLSRAGGAITLAIRWPLEEMPTLLTLRQCCVLKWSHHGPVGAGLPVQVHAWRACVLKNEPSHMLVQLILDLRSGDEPVRPLS